MTGAPHDTAVCRSCSAYFLGHNGIGPAGAVAIAEALQGNDQVYRLNLSGNPIGVEGVEALVRLAAALVRPLPSCISLCTVHAACICLQ